MQSRGLNSGAPAQDKKAGGEALQTEKSWKFEMLANVSRPVHYTSRQQRVVFDCCTHGKEGMVEDILVK